MNASRSNGHDKDDKALEAEDTQARNDIREKLDQNFMVEAAAGTGKTSCVVDRMVGLIASGKCEIQHLAAVTFTRKAAAELKERFQLALRQRAIELAKTEDRETNVRVQSASDFVGRAFIGTIHSLCAAILRERPIEFGVDPAFRELQEDDDYLLREQAWQENINDLFASEDPLIQRIDELGLRRSDLKSCFDQFIEYRDVKNWPCPDPPVIDLKSIQSETRRYIKDMKSLAAFFPTERGTDKLMERYEEIVRASDQDWDRDANFFSLLERFDTSSGATLKWWHDKKVAKAEKVRWEEFRESVAGSSLNWWYRKRYQFVVSFVRRAVGVYERQKAASGGLDFFDLLMNTAGGLRNQPRLREYFQSRYTHLLVDEFQDTDPIQAEILLLLASANVDEKKWRRCVPKPGALFLVGDPKQSIYRFRRGDIVTYNQVRSIFEQSGGEVLSLAKNFRSRSVLREWNNQVFQEKFLREPDAYTTAAKDMVQGRVDSSEGVLEGLRKLTLPYGKIDDVTRQEAESIAKFIRHAIDSRMRLPRTERDLELGRSPEAQASDFLIIPRGKKRIDVFKEALDRYRIPCDVTGGNAYASVPQLGVLIDCLRAIDDPHHAVLYLAILRDRLFGFSDADLFAYKQAGGRFNFTLEPPENLASPLKERFDAVHARLQSYRQWLRIHPFSVAVNQIAQDLGLLATVAAGSEGNIALGGFLKAIEALRQQSCDFDSVSDLISYLDDLEDLEETEGCTALPPNPNAARVMNLHKAKGLEAPVVFLADTTSKFVHLPICHIDRSGDETAGYMGITMKKGDWARKDVATPENWSHFQQEEQRYLNAEDDRLLYVATTRAESMLVVSVGQERSKWSDLHNALGSAVELDIPAEVNVNHDRETAMQPPLTTTTADSNSHDRWSNAMTASYEIESAKHAALQGTTRPNWQVSGDYGHQWGTAIHTLLEIATTRPGVDLRPTALLLSDQHGLTSDRVPELLATVQAVTESEIWKRSQASSRRFSELPFETCSRSESVPTITRGVIDLLFEQSDGWVIVDYKTDDIEASYLKAAAEYYRPQLQNYKHHWQELTGNRVVETGLYFTRVGRYVGELT